jgi:hypothetical protein
MEIKQHMFRNKGFRQCYCIYPTSKYSLKGQLKVRWLFYSVRLHCKDTITGRGIRKQQCMSSCKEKMVWIFYKGISSSAQLHIRVQGFYQLDDPKLFFKSVMTGALWWWVRKGCLCDSDFLKESVFFYFTGCPFWKLGMWLEGSKSSCKCHRRSSYSYW